MEFIPAIIRFLGYNPLPPDTTWAERLVLCPTAMGITQGEAARRIGVDRGTALGTGVRQPTGQFSVRAKRFLAATEVTSATKTRKWVSCRAAMGITQVEATRRLGVDPGKLGAVETRGARTD